MNLYHCLFVCLSKDLSVCHFEGCLCVCVLRPALECVLEEVKRCRISISVEYKNRVWEGKSIYITGAPDNTTWRAYQNYFGLVGGVEVSFFTAPLLMSITCFVFFQLIMLISSHALSSYHFIVFSFAVRERDQGSSTRYDPARCRRTAGRDRHVQDSRLRGNGIAIGIPLHR